MSNTKKLCPFCTIEFSAEIIRKHIGSVHLGLIEEELNKEIRDSKIEIKNTNLSFAHEYDVAMYHFTSLITSFISLTIYSSTSNIFHVNKLLTLTQAKIVDQELGSLRASPGSTKH